MVQRTKVKNWHNLQSPNLHSSSNLPPSWTFDSTLKLSLFPFSHHPWLQQQRVKNGQEQQVLENTPFFTFILSWPSTFQLINFARRWTVQSLVLQQEFSATSRSKTSKSSTTIFEGIIGNCVRKRRQRKVGWFSFFSYASFCGRATEVAYNFKRDFWKVVGIEA